MLPETIHPDDMKWFQQQMMRVYNMKHRIKACEAYSAVWKEAYDAEPLMHCKENAGRFAANSRLRAFIARIHQK